MSPKSLDPLSQRKNDSAAAESTSPVPRGVDATRVLEKAQATVEARKEAQAKSKRKVIFGLLFAGLIVFLAGAAITIFRDAQKNQLADDEYAIIEGRRITNTEFQELKSAYIRYDKQKKQENEKVSERRAADELLTRVGLEVQAEKHGVTVTEDDINDYLAPAYKQYGSKELLLAYNKNLYGWDEKPLLHKAKLDILKQKLQNKMIAEVDLLGVYIRWDNHMDKSEEFQKEYGRKAVERLEKDYLPRLNGGQVAGDFIKTTDVNASLPVELNNERLNKTDDPIVRYLELKSAVNDPKNDPFQHGQKASDAKSAWAEIEKLEKVGDTTPVFKSDSGMYLALRIERKSEGEYISYESYLKKAIKEGKVDSSYSELPIPDDGRNILPIPTSNADVSLLAKFLPRATASGSRNCWAQDPLLYEMRPADGSAGYAAITGNPFTVLVVRSGPDTCIPYSGFGYFMNGEGRQAWTSPNVQHGTEIPLNCYGMVWDFAWSAPSGYQGFTGGDYQASERILTGFGAGLVWAPSDISGLWRNAGIYYGIANGAGRYAVAPVFFPNAPPPPPPPTYNVIGGKYDRSASGNSGGAYAGARVRDTNVDDSSTSQPYNLGGRTQQGNHWIAADDVADWTVTGWRWQARNGHGEVRGNGNSYGFAANSILPDVTEILDFFYEPRPSAIQAGFLVRDPATGAISNPCTQSGYRNVPCNNGSVNLARNTGFSLPNGLVNSYFVDPVTQNISNGLTSFGNLYTGTYRATATSIPDGWRVAGYHICGENTNAGNCFPASGNVTAGNTFPVGISANRTRPVFFVLEPSQIIIKGDKKGPGTFNSNQNSDTTNLGVGTIDVSGQTISGNGQAGAWNRTVTYDTDSGNYGVRAVAPAGWQIRGYAYCISATTINSCASDDTVAGPNNQSGRIILEANGQTEHTVSINYQGTTPNINGVSIPTGGQVWVTFFFKPAPVTIQVRGKIDMQGGNTSANTDLNPCNYNDYKRNICTDVEVRPVRMNTVGVANTATPGTDLGDPAGGYGNCASKDYIPTKPGYDYGGAANTGFYCTTEGGNNRITQAQFLSGQGPLRYGYTLDARTGQISQNGNSSENNLAIVRNVYPGKYSFRHNNGPEYNNESAYDISQSTCAVGQADCSSSVAPNADISGCLLNHRRKAEFTAVSQFLWWTIYTPIIGVNNPNAAVDPNGQNYCTIMWSGAPGADSWSAGGSPESWNIGGNTPRECAFIPTGGWAYFPQWNTTTGQYGINAQGNGPCGYRKDSGAAGVNTYSMGVPVGTNFREQTFYYAPKFKLTNEALTCDTYTANLVYMPDPSRPVTTYFRINGNSNLMRTETSTGNDIMEITTQTSGPDAYRVDVNIPKYNGQGGILLKDGDDRQFEMFARFSDSSSGAVDSDLVAGYSSGARDFGNAGGSWKYSPRRVSSPGLMHQCRNDAVCDQQGFENQLDAISVMDADYPQSNEIEVTMQNTGESFWQQGYRDGNNNGAVPGTYHELVVTGGTLVTNNQYDTRAWYIPDVQRQIEGGNEVTPVALNPGASSYTFKIIPTPPKDGGTKFVLGFQMRQAKPASQGGFTQIFGSACQGDFEIKVSYKPWLRVQNGNVTALGEIENQPESARGVYKAENRTNGSPYKGSFESAPAPADAKPAINLHAQFTAAAEKGGSNFCSTNFYMLGFAKGQRTAPQPSDPYGQAEANAPQKSRNCSFDSVNLNIEQAEDSNGDGQKELKNSQMVAAANRAYSEYGQCSDTGTTPDVDDGPQELSPPAKYYRSWAPGSPIDTPSLLWLLRDRPNSDDNLPFGTHNAGPQADRGLYLVNTNAPRPCPTIFKLQTSGSGAITEPNMELGGFIYNAGRSTIVSDDTVYITGNIEARYPTDNSLPYTFQKTGVPDMAGLNKLPNLGIISAKNIVIASNVDRIDASLYAAGKVITCDLYIAEGGLNEDAAKTDKPGTTGSKWIRRGGALSLDSNPLATETEDPNIDEAPSADNVTASGCSNKLRITGSVTGGEGFTFGRNYVDFAGMVERWRVNEGGAFQEFGKFCNLSDVLGIRRVCNLSGERKDFDSPGNRGATNYYWLENRAGWPQNYYTGGPAEDIVGNGLSSFMPPPGFEDITASTNTAKYYNNTARPKF